MEENRSSASAKPVVPTPDTLASAPIPIAFRCRLNILTLLTLLFTELIKRLRILTTTLLPFEVDAKSINDPTSRIITPKVISAYTKAAGNLLEAVCPSSPRADVFI